MGIGDEVMITGEVRARAGESARRFAILNRHGIHRYHEVWEGNPRIAKPGEEHDEKLKICGHHRPYIEGYDAQRFYWREHSPPIGEFYFSESEKDFGRRCCGRVILEPHIKAGASPNKRWPWISWNKLAWLLQRSGIRVTQLGSPNTQLLEGAELIITPTFRHAAAVLANARFLVGSDGAMHHAAAALGVRAVVIRGGYIGPRVTGYAGQIDFFEGDGLGCGMRVPCGHCAAAMAAITPENVLEELEGML
jgi:ADP-heptose:LPS heptosyltransferase